MPRNIIEFNLKDGDGGDHQYTVHTFEAEDGMGICAQLYAALAGPAGQLLGGAVAKIKDRLVDLMDLQDGGLSDVMDDPAALDVIVDVLAGVPWGDVGRDVQGSIASLNIPQLARKLLAKAHRDGKPLADTMAYNEAYRANYTEQWLALWEVIKANRFFPWLGTSGSSKSEDEVPIVTSPARPSGGARTGTG